MVAAHSNAVTGSFTTSPWRRPPWALAWRIVQIQHHLRISNLMYIALDGNAFYKLPLDRFCTDTLINLVAFS